MNYAKLSLEELEELLLQQREHYYALTEAARNSRDTLASIMSAVNDKWGTAADLTAAEYIFSKVLIARPTAKKPNWPDWANTVRLMREADGRTHREICELFKFASQDAFWSTNILSPLKLRKHWETLCVQRDKPRAQNRQTTGEMWAEAMADTSWANDLGGF